MPKAALPVAPQDPEGFAAAVDGAREDRAAELTEEAAEQVAAELPDSSLIDPAYRRAVNRCSLVVFQLISLTTGRWNREAGSALYDGSVDASDEAGELLVDWLQGRGRKLFMFASVAAAFGRKAIAEAAERLHTPPAVPSSQPKPVVQ